MLCWERHAASVTANVVKMDRGQLESSLTIQTSAADLSTLKGLTVILKNNSFQTAFPILDAVPAGVGQLRLVTRRGDRGFEPVEADQAIIHYRSSRHASLDNR